MPSPAPPTWRTVWQMPALIAAGLMLAAGVGAAFLTAPSPNYDKLLTSAEGLIEHEDFRGALDVLNDKIRGYYDHGSLSAEQGRRFHLLRARAVYLGQKKAGIDNEKNATSIVEEYTEAMADGGTIPVRDQSYLADANVTLGKYQRALDLANGLPPELKPEHNRLLRRVVEHQLQTPGAGGEETLRLLADFLKDGSLTTADRAWALARQSELLLHEGLADRAIAKLVQTMPSLMSDCPPEQMGELYLLLGRAYWDAQAVGDAGRQLEQAAALLPEQDPRRADATVLLGKIDELTRQPPDEARSEAKQKYAGVAERFAGTPSALPALLGLGEVEAAMGDFEGSIRAYTTLVHEMAGGQKHPDVPPASVTTSLLDRFNGRLETGDTAAALRYATLGEGLYAPDATPPEVLLSIATAQRRTAEDLLKGVGSGGGRIADLAKADPATREQARLSLITAGKYFKRHAERVGIADNAAYGRSLWLAADSLDLAGDPEESIPLFADYAKYFPGEPRQAEARFRLAQAYQARGDYGTAAQYYRALMKDGAAEGSTVGPYADLSAVPLAQTLLMDSDSSNDAEAESLLEQVVSGRSGSADSPQFRDGLVQLAMLKHKRHDYAGAIGHLEEAVARFPSDPQIDDVRYQLADSYRQDAHAIDKTLDEGMPDHRKQALKAARIERLGKARELFEQVRRSLEAQDPRRLTKLEQLRLRNAYFYLGDTDFDLRDFEGAIRHYDAAREKYPKDPASLVAMIQIVNSYLELKDYERAKTANNRAKQFYDSLPPSVWNDPDLPMDKSDWQHWLDSINRLKPLTQETERAAPGEAH
jgi:tetratricopeptide (TPR) repeat protein